MSLHKLAIIAAVFFAAWWLLDTTDESQESGDAAEEQSGCGAGLKDTVEQLSQDASQCLDQLLGEDEPEGTYARVFFTYDQTWSAASDPYHDPLVSDHGASVVSNGEQLSATVQVYDDDDDEAWSATVQHGDLATLTVDFLDQAGVDRVVVTDEAGQRVEVSL